MLKFEEVNVNPKGHKTGDCSTRALVGTLEISYQEAINLQAKWAIKKCYGLTGKRVIELVLKEFGYVKMKQPRKPDGTKYLVGEMDEITTLCQRECGILVTVAGHHTCIKDDCVQDTWDCRDYTVGNYYVKANTIG